jgi:hypothetical protein
MTKKELIEKIGAELEIILKGLPEPLIQPIWYPGVPEEVEKITVFLNKVEQVLRKLGETVVRTLKDEGFFDENPLIRVYPQYPEASGIVIFYKGRKVFEKWINSFELNWGDKQQVADEAAAWYEEMRQQGMDPDEFEDYFDQGPGGRWQG